MFKFFHLFLVMLSLLSLQVDLLSQTIEELTLRADSLENRKQILLNEIDIIKQQLKTTKQDILLKESQTESNLNIIAETKRNTKLTEPATGLIGNVIVDIPMGAKLILMKYEYDGFWLAQYNNKIETLHCACLPPGRFRVTKISSATDTL